jgi:hypothetical protein
MSFYPADRAPEYSSAIWGELGSSINRESRTSFGANRERSFGLALLFASSATPAGHTKKAMHRMA